MPISHLASVVVGDLDVVGVAVNEPEADAPLVVDRDRVLSLPVPFELMQSVAGRDSQVVKARSQVDVLELPSCPLRDVGRETPRLARHVQVLRVPVPECLDHRSTVTYHVTRINHGGRVCLTKRSPGARHDNKHCSGGTPRPVERRVRPP